MSDSFLPENEPQIQARNPYPAARPGPIPDSRLENLFVEKPPSLVVREETSSSFSFSTATASTSCGPNDKAGACEKYFGSDGSGNTLPIVLGVVIPVVIAFAVLIYLHRRHVKKLKKEDAEDKHKSLDFGLGYGGGIGHNKKKGQKFPEMTMASEKREERGRQPRGLSMDLDMNNPYLLPPGLQGSRESLHSLSRSINGEDRYRPTAFIPDDGSIRSPSSVRSPADDASSWTGSSIRRFDYDSKQNLVPNAQPNPVGRPSFGSAASIDRGLSRDNDPPSRKPVNNSNLNLLAPGPTADARDSFVSTVSSNGPVSALRASNNYLAQYISGGKKQDPVTTPSEPVVSATTLNASTDLAVPPPVIVKDDYHSRQPSAVPSSIQEPNSTAPSITFNAPEDKEAWPSSQYEGRDISHSSVEQSSSAYTNDPSTDSTRQYTPATSTEPTRNDDPSHPPEPHAQNGVNTDDDHVDYYDEAEEYTTYIDNQDELGYDPRRLTWGTRPLPPDDPSENPEQRANRIRSFYKEYFDESKPQAPEQDYYDGSEGYYDTYNQDAYYDQSQYYPPRGYPPPPVAGRHRATVSNGSYMAGPRAFSSASSRDQPRYPMPRKQHLPPPKALNILPSPHLLKDGATMLPTDFAPPQKFSNQRSGTPTSLRGGARPYSPSVRAHVPLASSYDDLAIMPSP